jgi:hypothetical protein
MHVPPTSMDNKYNGLAVFMVPKSYLNTQFRMFLMFKDSTRPNESALPDEIYAQTTVLDQQLRQSLNIQNHPPTAAACIIKPIGP